MKSDIKDLSLAPQGKLPIEKRELLLGFILYPRGLTGR